MKLKPKIENSLLPAPVTYVTAFVLLVIAIGIAYYGINDGILHQDLMARGMDGRVVYSKGIFAIIFGVAFTAIGAGFAFLAMFIIKNERKQRNKSGGNSIKYS